MSNEINELVQALRHKQLRVRVRAVKALERVNWKPKNNIERYYFLQAKNKGTISKEGITDVSKEEINELVQSLRHKQLRVRVRAVKALERVNWKPKNNIEKQYFLQAKNKDLFSYKIGSNNHLNQNRSEFSNKYDKSFISINDVNAFSGFEFEYYLKLIFEKMGYTVENTTLSGDQGADLIITKSNSKTVVQAKRYKNKVSNRAVQEVVAAIAYYRADRAMVITNSEFTMPAIELAISNNVELIDGYKLEEYMKQYPIEKKEL